jgi:undecaprenyl phosphate-alpha-L-ara4N flippase subunit ArnE
MLESLKKNAKGIILLLISAFSLALGQLLWKKADLGLITGYFTDAVKPETFPWAPVLWVMGGFLVYAIGAVVMTIGLGYGELSVLQPINSMSYVFGLILSAIILHEYMSVVTIIGVVVVMAGVVVIGGSSKNDTSKH